jgi:hypothetical protein
MGAEPHFRRASWGMTKQQVRGLEGAPLLSEQPTQLIYRGTLVGRDCIIYYDFRDGRLATGAYLIDGHNDVEDVAAYEELVKLLTAKYGEPDSSGLEWNQLARRVRLETYGEMAKAIATGRCRGKERL